ncbi:MAG: 50S ribosomal protein L21 [Hyphomicrobiales bacterium]
MYAVIKTGGKQYKVTEDDVIRVEKVQGEAGDTVELNEVLMVGGDGAPRIGTPLVEGAMVSAEVLEQTRAGKIIVFKKKRRHNYRRKKGHRQHLTALRILGIGLDGKKPAKKAAAKAAPKKDAKADAKEEKKPAAKKEPAKKEAAPKAEIVDDLSLIGGVGPAFVKKLNGAGITSLKQIAEFDAKGVEKLEAELNIAGRVERDEWVEQAKELLAGKPPRAKVDQKAADTKDKS